MANLNVLAKTLGILGDAFTPPFAGAAQGALLAPAVEAQALQTAQQRQAFPLELQGMQQNLEAQRNALTRPAFHSLGGGRFLAQMPNGQSEIVTLPPSPLDLQRTKESEAKEAYYNRGAKAGNIPAEHAQMYQDYLQANPGASYTQFYDEKIKTA